MEETNSALVLLRALHMATLCTGFGSLLALSLLAPSVPARGALVRMASAALVAALLTLLPWFALQSATIAEVSTPTALPGAMAVVLTQTWFGHAVLGRAALMAGALLLSCAGLPTLALLPAALALASEAALGHPVNGEGAILALLAVSAMLGAALILRRLRLVAFGVTVLTTVFAVPHLSVLLVSAYPTSFYRSTTGGDPAAIAAGRALFATHCVACHGPDGRGDGPLARSQAVLPADLTVEHLLEHDDGELFWWLSHGMDRTPGPDGAPRQAMPGFARVLDEQAIWELIDFIRANNPYFASVARNRPSWGAPHVHTH